MGSLFAGLSIAVRAMQAEGSAAQVVSENIANINTSGYSRRLPILTEVLPGDTAVFGGGSGVTLTQVQAVRDRVLELRIAAETQSQSGLQGFQDAMQPVESLFDPSSGGGMESSLNGFFAALSNLATNPSDMTLRQNVMSTADSLTASVRSAVQQVRTAQAQAMSQAEQAAQQASDYLEQVANLNGAIAAAKLGGDSVDGFLDQRAAALQNLSGLMDFAVADSDDGITITTRDGAALVMGQQSFALQVSQDGNTGKLCVVAGDHDVTASIGSGKIGGLLQARDTSMERVITELDSFAYEFTNAFNAQHGLGFALDGSAAGDFFSPATNQAGAAASMSLALQDAAGLGCSSDQLPGSGGNLDKLSALAKSPICGTDNPSDFLAGMGFRIGSEISRAKVGAEAGDVALLQLQAQRSATSGVSLDEEAAQLMQYQRAYQAAARVFTVIDELTQTILGMGTQT